MAMKTKEKPFRHELEICHQWEPEKALLTDVLNILIQLDKHGNGGLYNWSLILK